MKTLFRSLCCAGAVAGALLGLASFAWAAEPTVGSSPGASTGRVLVLDNERTLTGDIEQVGDEYRIKRLLGETRVPVAKALRLCASLEEAHHYLASRANLRDPDERLRLADWCRQHGLKAQAVAEVEAANELKPNDARIGRMLRHLRDLQARAEAPRPPAQPEAPALPRVDVSADTLGQFATRIQPILMNACVSCHSAGRGGSFQLTRAAAGLANRKAVEHNLAMVLTQLNTRDLRASRLLIKAVSLHGPGMSQAPLKGKQAPAYRHLEQWVVRAMENNPHLIDLPAVSTTAAVPPPGVERSRPGMGWGEDRATQPPVRVASVPPGPTVGKEAPKRSADPLDPDTFNREFHPGRKGHEEVGKDKR